MSALKATPTRLQLLKAIAGDRVLQGRREHFYLDNGEEPGRYVGAAVREQIHAGWAELGRPVASFRAVRPTGLGYQILAEHFPEWRDEVTP